MGYLVSSSPDKLSIVVPRRFNVFLFVFIPLWIAGWITLTLKGNRDGQRDSVIGLSFFGIVSVLFMYEWLWNLGGKEELEVTSSTLTHRRVLFGIFRTRKYPMERIAAPHFVASKRRRRSSTPSGLGFYYGDRKIRVGDNLTQRDAKEIVAMFIRQFPESAKCWEQYQEGMPELDEDMTLNLK